MKYTYEQALDTCDQAHNCRKAEAGRCESAETSGLCRLFNALVWKQVGLVQDSQRPNHLAEEMNKWKLN